MASVRYSCLLKDMNLIPKKWDCVTGGYSVWACPRLASALPTNSYVKEKLIRSTQIFYLENASFTNHPK